MTILQFSNKKKESSHFVKTAIAFDADIAELERLSRAIESTSFDKESGPGRAQNLLLHFSECGKRVAEGVQALAKDLEAARIRAEVAAELVSSHAAEFQAFQDQSLQLVERFRALGEIARNLTLEMSEMRKTDLTPEALSQYLSGFDSRLSDLLDQIWKLRDDARAGQLKLLERNAENLGQTLTSARNKLKSIGK